MPAKIIVTNNANPNFRHERVFSQDVVTIGRDSSNVLHLQDDKKIISRRHAQLRYEDGNYQVIDCGSHNFTFLNNEKIARNIPYNLNDGDHIRIGEYILAFIEVKAAEERDATIVMVNPFYEEMKIFAGLYKKIRRTYENADKVTREDDLKIALDEVMSEMDTGEMDEVFARSIGKDLPANPPQKAANGVKDDPSLASLMFDIPSESLVSLRIGQVMDALMSTIISITKDARRFRDNYIGLSRLPKDAALHQKTAETLREYLLDTELSDEEAQQRFEIIKTQLDEVVTQHHALLDLYKVNINEGTKQLLNSIDPGVIKEEIRKEGFKLGPLKIPYGVVPFFLKAKMSDSLEHKINQLISKEISVFESDAFQPFFENAILKSKKEDE